MPSIAIPRIVELRTRILKKNDELARALRSEFAECGLLAVNVVSAPGRARPSSWPARSACSASGMRWRRSSAIWPRTTTRPGWRPAVRRPGRSSPARCATSKPRCCAGARRLGSERARFPHGRKRGQSGLPGELGLGRRSARARLLGDRGGGQAAQVSDADRLGRRGADQQNGSGRGGRVRRRVGRAEHSASAARHSRAAALGPHRRRLRRVARALGRAPASETAPADNSVGERTSWRRAVRPCRARQASDPGRGPRTCRAMPTGRMPTGRGTIPAQTTWQRRTLRLP